MFDSQESQSDLHFGPTLQLGKALDHEKPHPRSLTPVIPPFAGLEKILQGSLAVLTALLVCLERRALERLAIWHV
jgi:hypothetical protein